MRSFAFYIVLFLFFYLQPVNVGGIKISFITNAVILAFSINFLIRHKVYMNVISRLGMINAIKVLFSKGLMFDVGGVFIDFFRSFTFPIVGLYLYNRALFFRLYQYLCSFSRFLIISSLPFIFKLISPITDAYDLSFFGDSSGGFIGFFENTHSASCCISFSIIILVFNIFNSPRIKSKSLKYKQERIIDGMIILVGLYVLYSTYVRTGYLMLFLGLITMFVGFFNPRYIAQYIFASLLVGTTLFVLYQKDDTLRNKLSDNYENTNSEEENLGSGRLVFIKSSIDIWLESTITEQFFGLGMTEYKERMLSKVRLRIYAHNGFITSLLKDGLVGFVLYLIYMVTIIRQSFITKSPFRVLALSISISYLAYQMVQGNVISQFMEIMLAAIFVLVYKPIKFKKIRS